MVGILPASRHADTIEESHTVTATLSRHTYLHYSEQEVSLSGQTENKTFRRRWQSGGNWVHGPKAS
jgi:hypothetical protein